MWDRLVDVHQDLFRISHQDLVASKADPDNCRHNHDFVKGAFDDLEKAMACITIILNIDKPTLRETMDAMEQLKKRIQH